MEVCRLKLELEVSSDDIDFDDECNETSETKIAQNSYGGLESKWRLSAKYEGGGEWEFKVDLINYEDFKNENVLAFGTANLSGEGSDRYEPDTNQNLKFHEVYLQNLTRETLWHFDECYGGEGVVTFTLTADIAVIFQSKLQADFGKLFEKGVSSDIILTAEGKEFNVQKSIVNARSAVFEELLKPHMDTNTVARVEIKDISSQILQQVLKFLYTGAFTNSGKAGFLEDLFLAAEKFEMVDLKKCVGEHLCDGITDKNVENRQNIAEKFGVLKLKERWGKFFKNDDDDNSSNDDVDNNNSSVPVGDN